MRGRLHYCCIMLMWCLMVGSLTANDEVDALIDKLEAGNDQVLDQLLDKQDIVLKRLLQRIPEKKGIDALLKELGHEAFAKRKAATKALLHIGPRITPDLQAYLKTSQDPEVKMRCKDLLDKLSQSKQKIRATQRIKFLAEIGDLPTEVIHHFSFAYRDYMAELNADKAKDGERSKQEAKVTYPILTYFAGHYSKLPNSAEYLCQYALKVTHRYFPADFARAALDADKRVAIRSLLLKSRLPKALEVIGEHCATTFAKEDWDAVVKRLLTLPLENGQIIHPVVLKRIAPHMAPYSDRFLNSDNLWWQLFGLTVRKGSWKEIRPQAKSILSKTKEEANEWTLTFLTTFLEPPKEEMPWFLEYVMGLKDLNLRHEIILDHCKRTVPLPVSKILAIIERPEADESRLMWADALLELRPDLRNSVEAAVEEAMNTTKEGWLFNQYLLYAKKRFGKTIKIGELDQKWLAFFAAKQKARRSSTGVSFVTDWKVSPRVAFPHLKKLPPSRSTYGYGIGFSQSVAHMCTTGTQEENRMVIDFVLAKVDNDEAPYLDAPIYAAIISQRPDEAISVLKRIHKQTFTGEPRGRMLLHYLTSYHEGRMYGVNKVIAVSTVPLVEKLRTLSPDDDDFMEWFPYACFLSQDSAVVSKHEKLLAKRLDQMVPKLTFTEFLHAALIASTTVKLSPTTLDHILLNVAKYPQYEDDSLYLLNPSYSAAIPKLIQLSKKENSVYPLRVAFMISPTGETVLKELRQIVRSSNDAYVVKKANKILALSVPQPWAKAFDIRQRYSYNKFATCKRTEEKVSRLASVIRQMKNRVPCRTPDSCCSHLVQGDDTSRRIVRPFLMKVLKGPRFRGEHDATRALTYFTENMQRSDLEAVHDLLKKRKDEDLLADLMAIVSTLGQEASFMAETIRQIDVREPRADETRYRKQILGLRKLQLTCLANVSPDANERRQCLRELMEHPTGYWEVFQVRGQPDLTEPYWENMLKELLSPKDKSKKALKWDESRVLVWHLLENPNDKTFTQLQKMLALTANNPMAIEHFTIERIFQALLDHYEPRISECAGSIATLPLEFKTNVTYWQIARKIRATKNTK